MGGRDKHSEALTRLLHEVGEIERLVLKEDWCWRCCRFRGECEVGMGGVEVVLGKLCSELLKKET
jgi:hypothetical protein